MRLGENGKNRGAEVSRGGWNSDASGFGLVEVLVALAVGSIGILAVAGLHVAAVTQSRIAEWRTTQTVAADQVFEDFIRNGYGAATSGTVATTVRGDTVNVNVTVTNSGIRVRQVTVRVPAIGSVSARTFVRRIYQRRPLPVAP